MTSAQRIIAEMMGSPGMTSTLSGASMAQGEQDVQNMDDGNDMMTMGNDEPTEDDELGFTSQQLKIAKRFVELMGGADKARAAIDKVDECDECLDMVDDDQEGDSEAIERMAGMLPSQPDLPMALSNMYNPSAVGGPMM